MTWQVDDVAVQQLPLHCWQFFDDYPQAALTFSFLNIRHVPMVKVQRQQPRVLLVLGMADGLDVEADREIWQSSPAEVYCLVQPTVQVLHEVLWEAEGWDIFCFSGHSAFQGDHLWLNDQESLSLEEMRYALRQATQQGLALTIFNCCQGLQLAQQLAGAASAGVVVMREPVPDEVAQIFLQYLLVGLEAEIPTAHVLKQAREQLQGIEIEFPKVTWLLMLFGQFT